MLKRPHHRRSGVNRRSPSSSSQACLYQQHLHGHRPNPRHRGERDSQLGPQQPGRPVDYPTMGGRPSSARVAPRHRVMPRTRSAADERIRGQPCDVPRTGHVMRQHVLGYEATEPSRPRWADGGARARGLWSASSRWSSDRCRRWLLSTRSTPAAPNVICVTSGGRE
jgi:hypothetical protein